MEFDEEFRGNWLMLESRMQEETLDMKQGERSMISREDNEINEKETM